jgi:hypothetical protein
VRPYGTCNGDISMTADNAYVLYINGMAQVSVNRGNAVDNIAGCDARCVPFLPRPPVGVLVPSHAPIQPPYDSRCCWSSAAEGRATRSTVNAYGDQMSACNWQSKDLYSFSGTNL